MKNKKVIMSFAGLFILIFHLWINVTNLPVESYIRQLCVIGVDIFFFVSAFLVAKIKKEDYKNFIINRFSKIYFKFLIFAFISFLLFHWNLLKLIKVILGIEFISKGGGAFLWFIPCIMCLYLILPLYKYLDSKHPILTPIIAIILNVITGIIISFNHEQLSIIVNRIPIILIGYYFSKYEVMDKLSKKQNLYWLTSILLFIFGLGISYISYIKHFDLYYFNDIFYIIYIPFIIGLILLLDKIKVNKIFNLIGSITLELYILQMIFGFKIANQIYMIIKIPLFSNFLTIIIMIIFSILVNKLFKMTDHIFKKIRKKKLKNI